VTTPIVDVQDLRKTYRSFSITGRRRIDAVQGVSLQAYAGEVFGILGPNGAGKTTLIKMLLGVVKPTAGSATLFGQTIGSALARTRVGYLPESLRVDRHHTARSALKFYGRMSGMSAAEIRPRSDELLELVGLTGRDRESVRRFSKGMYQRLGLAQALMHDPDLLVLDEPTDGLDPVGRNEVRRVIERLRDAGKTIFLNSHILQEVELVCTRVAILAKGQIRAIGTLDQLSHSEEQLLWVDLAKREGTSRNVDWNALFGPDAKPKRQSEQEAFAGNQHAAVGVDEMPGLIRLQIPVSSQAEIDRVVDRLRAAGHSICNLRVKRDSLEDTFIRLVSDAGERTPLARNQLETPSTDNTPPTDEAAS
jgi:ABC-2 type transport system ATP-binding protein